jgi:hypothetical protein
MIISAKLNVSAIDKTKLFKGEKGTYLDITLLENRDGTDQYGNDFMVVQDLGKEARERGEKGPILGNAKIRVQRDSQRPAQSAPAPRQSAPQENLDEDVPF